MNRRKGNRIKTCLICAREVVLYNNDVLFSWHMHIQELDHIQNRPTQRKENSVKNQKNMMTLEMKDFFKSSANIDSLADSLESCAQIQLSKQNVYIQISKSIAHIFKQIYRGHFVVILFGSRITGLTTKDSGDLDIFIDTSEEKNISLINNPPLENLILRKAMDYMMKYESDNWVNVAAVLTCRTPILKSLHFDTKMQCDITVMNGLGIINTQMMCMFLNYIPKLRPLILILREWSTDFDCVKEINNYALSLIVLFYLQQEKYAPSIDELKYDYVGPRTEIGGYECLNYELVQINWKSLKSTNTVSLKQLLHGFFDYYANFNFENEVICPLLGKSVPKKLFTRDGKKLPPEMYEYVKNLKDNGEAFKIDNNGMYVQDPIDLSHNILKHTNEQFVNNFKALCETARRALDSIS